jgi:hypothetical protein
MDMMTRYAAASAPPAGARASSISRAGRCPPPSRRGHSSRHAPQRAAACCCYLPLAMTVSLPSQIAPEVSAEDQRKVQVKVRPTPRQLRPLLHRRARTGAAGSLRPLRARVGHRQGTRQAGAGQQEGGGQTVRVPPLTPPIRDSRGSRVAGEEGDVAEPERRSTRSRAKKARV